MTTRELKCGEFMLVSQSGGYKLIPYMCHKCDWCIEQDREYNQWRRAQKMESEIRYLFQGQESVGVITVRKELWGAFSKYVQRNRIYVWVTLETGTDKHVCFLDTHDVDGIGRYYDTYEVKTLDDIEKISWEHAARNGSERARQFKHMQKKIRKLYEKKHTPFVMRYCKFNAKSAIANDAYVCSSFLMVVDSLKDRELAKSIAREDDPDMIAKLMEQYHDKLAMVSFKINSCSFIICLLYHIVLLS